MKYERLEVEVIKFSTEDVIATSMNPDTCSNNKSSQGKECKNGKSQQA